MDLTRPLFSFGSEEKDVEGNDASARFYFTPNGQLFIADRVNWRV